jgi:hypothetical protein
MAVKPGNSPISFEKKILRQIFGPVTDTVVWRIHTHFTWHTAHPFRKTKKLNMYRKK